MTLPIYARWTDDLFLEATFVSTPSPMTSFSDDTFADQDPGERIRWHSGDVDIEITPAVSGTGKILVIPVSNADETDGVSPIVVRVTSPAGLDVSVTVPAMGKNGISRTLAVDLELLEPDATKRAVVAATPWTLHLTNSVDLILGAFVALYGEKRTLDDVDADGCLDWGFSYSKTHAVDQQVNNFLARYRTNNQTMMRSIVCSIRCEAAGVALLEDFYDANYGMAKIGLLWIPIAAFGAFAGLWTEKFEVKQNRGGSYDVKLGFDEAPKGRPVAGLAEAAT